MKPKYLLENRYSFVVDAVTALNEASLEILGPETSFERQIQSQLALANRLLLQGKHSAALEKYVYLRGLVSTLVFPRLFPIDGFRIPWGKVDRPGLLDTVVRRSAEMLKQTPPAVLDVPRKLLSGDVQSRERQFDLLIENGLRDPDMGVGLLLQQAHTALENSDYQKAADTFHAAAKQTSEKGLQAAILHDMAVAQERSGQRREAFSTLSRSAEMYAAMEDRASQVAVMTTLAGAKARAGDEDGASELNKNIKQLSIDHNLFDIAIDVPMLGSHILLENPVINSRVLGGIQRSAGGIADVSLLSTRAFSQRREAKQLGILGSAGNVIKINLNGDAPGSLKQFYDTLAGTLDVGLLTDFLTAHATTVAYLPHVYFWNLPMAIGDCHAALGSYAEAENEYLSTFDYKYLNQEVEAVNLWLRLAELYLDWGDRLYRQAANDTAAFGAARDMYERVMSLDNKLDDGSPLYSPAIFAALKARAATAIQVMFVDGAESDDNPRLLGVLARARLQLTKITNGLNFLGVSLTLPPFSFEHLQTVARYFAQHASQVEGMYLQFQSSGESEQLREQQMSQQVAIATASVELERRGVNEAREGVDVASANRNASNVQAQNAQQMANDFAAVRSELLELEALQAWSAAAAMDADDEVRQTITGYTYYSASGKKRSQVLKELARQRAQISHRLEANRLQREINAAAAYLQVAQQQVQQAQARVSVAQQRVTIARLQEQQSQENQDFLQSRELSSVMWYNLAREAHRLAVRYLDMAIEVATMMERAYEAETGRNLRTIKLQYGMNHLHGMLAADALLADIDVFTLDNLRTRAKKAQLRQSLSLADLFPMAFRTLISTGTTYFETTLEHFDRRYPGYYLQKIKQVEVVFVGLTGSEGVHGTLRNIGLSQFRQKDGSIVSQTYPADVMPLSEYNIRQDAIVFQLDAKELRLFENNGVATMWRLDLPLATNTFDLRQILDIQVVLYYDGFFDAALEEMVLAALPATDSSTRALSLAMTSPDELYFLRSQGKAVLTIQEDLLPANHQQPVLTSYAVQVTGPASPNLKIRLDSSNLGTGHLFTLDAAGNASGVDFADPIGRTPYDEWTVAVSSDDNPGVDLAGITDVSLYFEYDFAYRA